MVLLIQWLRPRWSFTSLHIPSLLSSSYYPRWVWSWDPQRLLTWTSSTTSFGFSVFDEVVWSLVTALESVVLVSMLAFFFLFCGCSI